MLFSIFVAILKLPALSALHYSSLFVGPKTLKQHLPDSSS